MKKLITLLGTILLLVTVGLTSSAATVVSANPISQEKRLAKAAADALVGELKEGLADLIEDEEAVAAIVKKWEARNLAGQTRTQILGVLFADVKSVVEDKETQYSIWEGWQEVGLEEAEADEEEEEPPAKPPTQPAKPAETPAPKPATGNPEVGVGIPMKGTILTLNQSKQFGYISAENGNKYFFHFSVLNGVRGESLREGQNVVFKGKRGNNGYVADNVGTLKP